MKLKDLQVGYKFKFINGNGKTWKKLSNNGDIAEYNTCLCFDDLKPKQKTGPMVITGGAKHFIKRDAEIIVLQKQGCCGAFCIHYWLFNGCPKDCDPENKSKLKNV